MWMHPKDTGFIQKLDPLFHKRLLLSTMRVGVYEMLGIAMMIILLSKEICSLWMYF